MRAATEDDRIHDLFLEAVELPAQERAAWIARRVDSLSTDGRQFLNDLLVAHDEAGTFLDDPSLNLSRTFEVPGEDDAATTDGRMGAVSFADMHGDYEIVARIGKGGYGDVFRAIQREPVRRPVAVKVLNWGMDSDRILARFDVERQTLARMEHDGIAKLYDAGSTPSGRPFFAMELVDGPPITEYCRTGRLPLNDRLQMMMDVCRAVQHAHTKGIIHRDLKPTNVLVGQQDGRPRPKIIDFGIAKATEGHLADLALTTEAESGLGTLQYMSPEQTSSSADVDTRSDVYGLGAILYELVTGVPPFDGEALLSLQPIERLQHVREVEPDRPSDRRKSVDIEKSGLPATEWHSARLRRELDWIITRAMTKEPARRYASAEALAEDLRRFLVDEPVQARPPTLGYRARKLIRRRRRMIAVVTLLTATAAISSGAVLYAKVQHNQQLAAEEDRLFHKKLNEVQANLIGEGQTRVEQALAWNRYLDAYRQSSNRAWLSYLSADDPSNPTDEAAAIARTNELAKRLTAKQEAMPLELEASLQLVLARSYQRAGRVETAVEHARQAIQLFESSQRLGDAELLQAMDLAATSLISLGQYGEAEPIATHAVDVAKGLIVRAAYLPPALATLAVLRASQGQIEAAESTFQQAIKSLAHDQAGRTVTNFRPQIEAFATTLQKQGHLDLATKYRSLRLNQVQTP